MSKNKASFDAVMASTGNGRRRVSETVCFSPDLSEEYNAYLVTAISEKAAADNRPPGKPSNRRSGDDAPWVAQLKSAAKLIEDNPEAFYEVEFVQLDPKDWDLLLASHSPRDDNYSDSEAGYNTLTFPPAALAASMADPEPTDDRIAFFVETLGSGEMKRLAKVVYNLNEGVRSVPKVEHVLSNLGISEPI